MARVEPPRGDGVRGHGHEMDATGTIHADPTRWETVVEAYVCNGCVRGTQVRALTHTVVSFLYDTHTYNKSLG